MHIAVYGNIQMSRGYCYSCKSYSLIKNNTHLCCESPTSRSPHKIKRMTETFSIRKLPPLAWRRDQVVKQNNACAYCGSCFDGCVLRKGKPVKVKLCWDHIVPYAYSQNNNEYNFLASCSVCNLIKSSKMFQTIEEVQIYVSIKRNQKGYV